MGMRRPLRLSTSVGCAAVLAVTALSACSSSAGGGSGSSGSAGAAKDFNITALLPLSGELATYGHGLEAAQKAAVAALTQANALHGVKINYTAVDDKGDPAQTAAAVQQVIGENPKPDFVIAGGTSTEAAAALPALTKAKIYSGSYTSTTTFNDPKTYPYEFCTAGLAQYFVQALVDYVKSKGVKSIGVVTSDNELGHATVAQYAADGKAAGLTVNSVYVPDDAVDVTAQLEKLKSSNPAALVYSGFGPVSAAMLKARATLGWDVPVYADTSFSANDLGGATTAQLKGVTLMEPGWGVKGDPGQNTPAYKSFSAHLEQQTSTINGNIGPYVGAWNTVALSVYAAAKAKSYSAADLTAATESLQRSQASLWVGLSSFGFSSTNHCPQFQGSDFVYYPAGPTVNGVLVPGNGH